MQKRSECIEIVENECYGHEEHIIQNALGGRLKSYNVLCESCGGTVNKSIDASFIKLFSAFTSRMDKLIRRDRETDVWPTAVGHHNLFDIPVKLQDNKILPGVTDKKLDKESNELHIFAVENTMKNYGPNIIKKVEEQYGKDKLNFIKHEHFEPSKDIEFYFSKNNPDFNSQLGKGITKIAVEYAYYSGVGRKYLNHHIDKENNTFFECKSIGMYRPLNIIHRIADTHRELIDENFPNHMVMLYTIDFSSKSRYLYCFVELFGTFQYYVLLNDNYKGEAINTSYAQRLRPKPKANLKSYSFEELYLFSQENDINISELDFGADIDKIRDFIQEKLDKKPEVYQYDLRENIIWQFRTINREWIKMKMGIIEKNDIAIFLQKLNKDKHDQFEQQLKLTTPVAGMELCMYRQVLTKYSKGEVEHISMADQIFKDYIDDPSHAHEFGHFKTKFLDFFIEEFNTI
jgi:hypothetical protein